MLRWSFIFIVLAIIAGIFSYGKIWQGEMILSKILLVIFSILSILFFRIENKTK